MFDNYYRGKRVLVTGHTGFKGSWLSQWLLDLGATVAGFSIGIPTQPSNFEVLNLEKRLSHFLGDIRDIDSLNTVIKEFKPEVLFHLAAQSIVRTSYDAPKSTFDTNTGGTINILEILRHGSSIQTAILITSDKCYDNVEWEWGYRENDRLGGKDPYSASKACAELATRAYVESFFQDPTSVRLATTRAGNVIGGGDWAKDRIVPDCIRAWMAHETPVIRNPSATRPWQHVLEPLSGYLALGSEMAKGKVNLVGEAFNFGPVASVNQPVSRLIDKMLETWKGNQWKNGSYTKDNKKEATLLKLNCDKAFARLGWQPTITFDESVTMTAQWYQTYYSKSQEIVQYTSGQISEYQKLAALRNHAWAIKK